MSLDQIRVLYRFREIPMEGAIADLMWSDPEPEKSGFYLSQRFSQLPLPNLTTNSYSCRLSNAGYTFGADVVEAFLRTNKLQHILRAHQLCMDGYQVGHSL